MNEVAHVDVLVSPARDSMGANKGEKGFYAKAERDECARSMASRAQPGSQRSGSKTLRQPARGSGAAGAGGTKQHAGKGLAVHATQQRAGWRRTSHRRHASSEEEKERANALLHC